MSNNYMHFLIFVEICIFIYGRPSVLGNNYARKFSFCLLTLVSYLYLT